jgi:hypothetical protein
MRFRLEPAGTARAERLEEIAARRTHRSRRPDNHLEIALALRIAQRARRGVQSAKFIRILAWHLKPIMAATRHANNNAWPSYERVTAG